MYWRRRVKHPQGTVLSSNFNKPYLTLHGIYLSTQDTEERVEHHTSFLLSRRSGPSDWWRGELEKHRREDARGGAKISR
jgi:hypothetical protein